jgi:NAD(P)-dependent dehydrogenase (short-subunit alcohol dehydrogenase family)
LDLNLRGRVAIVTGGSQGMGYATAEQLLREGVAVAICARDEQRLEDARKQLAEATGGRVEALSADVSEPEQVERFVRETERRLGPVEILVNNAANYRDGDMWEMPEEYWQHHISNKLLGYTRFVRLLVPGMKERRWGRIINLGGGASRHVILGSGTAGPVNAAIANYTKYIATELAPFGIRVNLVNPGGARTQRREIAIQRRIAREGLTREQVVEDIIRNVPIGRMIEASDAAKLITFLCSDCADAIVGQAISCDGGSDRGVDL